MYGALFLSLSPVFHHDSNQDKATNQHVLAVKHHNFKSVFIVLFNVKEHVTSNASQTNCQTQA